MSFSTGTETIHVTYRFAGPQLCAAVDGRSVDVQLLRASATTVDAQIDGVRRRYAVTRCGNQHYVDSSLGSTTLTELQRFPDPTTIVEAGSMLAPMPGSVVRIEVAEGAMVTAGTPIVVLEAMKMEHTVRAPADGVVATISVTSGQQVATGEVLAIVQGDQQ